MLGLLWPQWDFDCLIDATDYPRGLPKNQKDGKVVPWSEMNRAEREKWLIKSTCESLHKHLYGQRGSVI